MLRMVFALALLVGVSNQATAQSRSWVPWEQIGAGSQPSWNNPASRSQPRQSLRGQEASESSFATPAQRRPVRTDAFPELLQGGPRPAISPRPPQSVAFRSEYATGSVVIDSGNRMLYFITSPTSAYRYPVSVGREGFDWFGSERISRIATWPDWHPPAEMRERDPRLPLRMTGGINNPLGAMALYLGSTLYRIHGTNDIRSIGYAASSGCFRMLNEHVVHLASLVGVGTRVHVVPSLPGAPRVATRSQRSAAIR